MSTLLITRQLPLVSEFLNTLTSENTLRAYEYDLREFQSYLNTGVEAIHWNSILGQYKAKLRDEFEPLTCNRKLSCLKSYFRFLYLNQVLNTDVSQGIELFSSLEYSATRALSDSEVRSMLLVVDKERDALILLLLFVLGLRRSELINIKLEDLNLGGLPSIKIIGKGHKSRILPLTKDILSVLNPYLENLSRAKYTGARLFPGKKSETLHPNSVVKILKKYSKLANVEGTVSPHVARATCVSNALERGATAVQVQQLGGWSSMDMVLRYDKRRQALSNSAAFIVNYAPKYTGKK